MFEGKVGESYNIGGRNEKRNIDVIHTVFSILEELCRDKPKGFGHRKDLISYVEDCPGYDLRDSVDASKTNRELGWEPEKHFESGIWKRVECDIAKTHWWERALDGSYRAERFGLNT